jgi:hypothetical protein
MTVSNMASISRIAAPANDHQKTAKFVLDTGRRLEAKFGSSHSTTEIKKHFL